MTLNLDSQLESLLARGKSIPALPDLVRARALARARATAAMAARRGGIPRARRRPLTVALAASAALAILTATAVAAFRVVTRQNPPVQPTPTSPMAATETRPAAATIEPTFTDLPIASPSLPVARHQRATHLSSALDSYAAELDLLHRAQTAYVGHDFAGALTLVAEHGRRFPNGRLAEEREALRVRSLAGAGRTAEAHRAAAAFAERFPRSVLVPRLGD
jgi:hypothetical protein